MLFCAVIQCAYMYSSNCWFQFMNRLSPNPELSRLYSKVVYRHRDSNPGHPRTKPTAPPLYATTWVTDWQHNTNSSLLSMFVVSFYSLLSSLAYSSLLSMYVVFFYSLHSSLAYSSARYIFLNTRNSAITNINVVRYLGYLVFTQNRPRYRNASTQRPVCFENSDQLIR